jgi:hypothetical protein
MSMRTQQSAVSCQCPTSWNSQLNLDVKAFGDALAGESPDYAKAEEIYRYGGGQSCWLKAGGRSLQYIATKDLAGETFFEASTAPSDHTKHFWDWMMINALQGKAEFAYRSHVKRVTCLKKFALGLVTYFAAHEIEEAITLSVEERTRSDARSGHRWDGGWAFYHGTDGTSSPWEVAGKQDSDFPDGMKVQATILKQFNAGLVGVRKDTFDKVAAEKSRDTIHKLWAITYLRAALKYLQISEDTYSEKAHAEGYAYFKAIYGWVYSHGEEGKAAASALRDALDIGQGEIPLGTYCAAKEKLEKAYPNMGINCAWIGKFKDEKIDDCTTTCDYEDAEALPDGADIVAAVEGDNSEDVKCPYEKKVDDATTTTINPTPINPTTTTANDNASPRFLIAPLSVLSLLLINM